MFGVLLPDDARQLARQLCQVRQGSGFEVFKFLAFCSWMTPASWHGNPVGCAGIQRLVQCAPDIFLLWMPCARASFWGHQHLVAPPDTPIFVWPLHMGLTCWFRT